MTNVTNINGDEKCLNTYSDDNSIYSSVNLDISNLDFIQQNDIKLIDYSDFIEYSGAELKNYIMTRENEYGQHSYSESYFLT